MKKTISTLIASILMLTSHSFAEEEVVKHEFVGTKQCKMCHNKPDEGKQYTVWKAAPHAQAYTILLGDHAKEVAK